MHAYAARFRKLFTPAAAAVLLAACAGGSLSPAPAIPSARGDDGAAGRNARGVGKIRHVVIVFQENRSFDNLFAGYPGADTVASGRNSLGRTVRLSPVSLTRSYVIDHSVSAMFSACDGSGTLPGTNCAMDGFDLEASVGGPPNPQYAYVPHDESKPYFDMAHEWVLADRMFQSHLDESF